MATDVRLEAIVLAAGSGSRFGGGKLTSPYATGHLIDGALAAAFAAPVWRVTVVVGADPKVAEIAAQAGARVVIAHDHAAGLAASLRTGINSLAETCTGVFVFLGDMPRVPHAVLPLLAKALEGKAAAAPAFAGQRGHPALIGNALFEDVLALKGDAGAGRILAGLGDRLATVDAPDDGVLFDVDVRP